MTASRAKWWEACGVFGMVMLALLTLRHEVLSQPPYEDNAIGNWTESHWLQENNFDYLKLRYEPHGLEMAQAPRGYLISIQPTLLAILKRFLPDTPAVIFCQHLWGFTCGALIVALTYSILRDRVGRSGALLAGIAAFTTPLVSVQVNLAGMDVPLAAGVLGAALMVHRQRWTYAALLTMLAFWLKATGFVVIVALLSLLVTKYFCARVVQHRPFSGMERHGLIASFAVLAVAMAVLLWAGKPPVPWHIREADMVQLWFACYVCPDVVLLLAITSLALANSVASTMRHRQGSFFEELVLLASGERDDRLSPVVPFCMLIVGGMMAAMWSTVFLVRYVTLSVPLLYVVLFHCVAEPLRLRRTWVAVLAAVVALNLFNASGRLFPEIPGLPASLRAGEGLTHRIAGLHERSHLQAVDQQSYIDVCRWLEEQHREALILVDFPLNLYLRPEMGYVSQRLPYLYHLGDLLSIETENPIQQAFELAEPGGPILIHVESHGDDAPCLVPPPKPQDEILFDDGQPEPLIAYRIRSHGKPLTAEAFVEEYFRRIPILEYPSLAVPKVAYLLQRGLLPEAIQESDNYLTQFPKDLTLRRVVIAATLKFGDVDTAQRHLAAMAQSGLAEVDDANLYVALAANQWSRAQFANALANAEVAYRVAPDQPVVVQLLAWMLATNPQDNLRNGFRAIGLAEKLCAMTDRQDYMALDSLAAAYAEAGRFDDALSTLREALQLARARGDQARVAEFTAREQLYNQSRPYHQEVPGK